MNLARLALLAGALGTTACAANRAPAPAPTPAAAVPPTTPADSAAVAASVGSLPPVPSVHGPLQLHVAYPAPGDLVLAGDSSFMFGTTGTGDASLTINGQPVRVAPNGAWLAWLRFPRDSIAQFVLDARTPTDSAQLVYQVHRALGFQPPDTGLWIDTTSFSPRGTVWLPADEYLPLSVRATPGATLRLRVGDSLVIPLHPLPTREVVAEGIRAFDRDTAHLQTALLTDHFTAAVRGLAIGSNPGPIIPVPGAETAALPAPPAPQAATLVCDSVARDRTGVRCAVPSLAAPVDTTRATLEVIRGADTVRAIWPLRVALLDTVPVSVLLDDDSAGTGTTDSLTVGRSEPAATYNWFFPTGTRAEVSERRNGDLRLQLASGAVAWVALADAHLLPPGIPAPRATIGSVTLTPLPDRASLRIPVGVRIPFQTTESERTLELRFYGAQGDVNWIRYGTDDSLIESIRWSQPSADQVVLTITTSAPLWGWRTTWDRDDLVLDIRRPPAIDPGHPLAHRLIVVDPGHPPLGASGPTGLKEADANLAIGLKLRDLLEDAGARVVMTRTTDVPVALYARTHLADTLGADLLVSIHNNALPDGVNPFPNNGTSTFYNHLPSLPLARDVQRALVRRLGLRDLGVGRGDLALVRPTWMPAILTEGLYLMVPEQEAALRSPEGQELYAQGVFDGIRNFLRERGDAQRR
ncbi:MAG TPA: N-acetylmuramoyl-L-alanine amidase [Gemmatimonadales bacterium]|nr:N-acetylmuramoyl-L-alanine amidase [Gemmatimonadales bacterium]